MLSSGCTLKDIGTTCIQMAKVQKYRASCVKKSTWEVLKERLTKSQEDKTFSRIPSEVPRILVSWKHGAERTILTNAAA